MKWSELDSEEKRTMLLNTRKNVKFPLYIIEKDWWVVQTLRLICQMDMLLTKPW